MAIIIVGGRPIDDEETIAMLREAMVQIGSTFVGDSLKVVRRYEKKTKGPRNRWGHLK